MIRHLTLVLFIILQLAAYTQDSTGSHGKYRFFIDESIDLALIDYAPYEIGNDTFDPSLDFGFGLHTKIGNNWYLSKGKFNGVLSFTWLRLGALFYDGLYLYVSPANIGLGHHFQLGPDFAIKTMVHGGVIIANTDILGFDGYATYFVMPELKFHINQFSLGLNYTFRQESNSVYISPPDYYHYLGFTTGYTFGVL